ncbi:ATP-dependent DNA helicase PIF1 [Mycena galericulata]|nr:ATP-dependent DNA helicase PIF1 [Mycena galericulata]
MWIGQQPFELKILTLPERLLIALYFPAVYVVKLYPKVKGARFWDKRTVNSGLKGNVSTYRLNSSDIADIVAGVPKSLPPSPRILAATIGVTFVGRGNKPLSVLPDFLKVRRQRVFEALVWLKRNNPLYERITIAEEQLLLLPENAVPEEILVNTRISEDVEGLEREHAGYVPVDAAEEAEEFIGPDTDCAAAFPLHTHGVIDVHADGVPDSDVSAHGFANATSQFREANFKVRKDSAFVNEYARLDVNGERFDGGPSNPNHMLGAFPVLFPYGKGGFEVERDVDVPYESHDLYFMFQAFGVVQKREIKRSSFIANQVAFMNAEETRRVPFSNPVVRKLRKHLTSLRVRVPGTDESRISIRSQIWGMNLRFNPPSIWATINLADTTGENIDLDRFVATAGPGREAPAEFFHYTIKLLLEEAFVGIVGLVNGYIGTVEAQGRGTLHLHILFWLAGAPTEAFREKMLMFIKQTDAETITATKKKPVDPREPNYDLRRHEAEADLARAVQFHDCKLTTCLKVRGGRLVCKRRAPFTFGEWGPRRMIRANQDIKLITNGHETKDIAFYITLYIAKKQIQSKSLAFHRKMNSRNRDCRDVNRRMITQQQELSGPEVVQHISHKFITATLRRTFPEPSLRLQVNDGVFVLKDQPKEYTDRGHELDNMNFYDYFVETYHGSLLKAPRDEDPGSEEEGRPPSRRGCRIIRGPEYETVAQFIGTWFPRADSGDYYYASDLVPAGSTFSSKFAALTAGANKTVKRVVANVAYYHECTDGAKRAKETALAPEGAVDNWPSSTTCKSSGPRRIRYQYRDWLYAEHAMSVAMDVGVFTEEQHDAVGELRGTASIGDALKYLEWGKKVSLMTRAEMLRPSNTVDGPIREADLNVRIPRPLPAAVVEEAPAGEQPEQLLMITVLLNAIAHTFAYLGASDTLAKTATTGVAASLVGGQTDFDGEEGPSSKPTHTTAEKRKRNILPAKYLDIDECSILSQIVGEVRDAAGIGDPSKPFGALNFPPVADPTGALYCLRGSKTMSQLGLEIYRQFTTVVTLTEQKRITDLPWKHLLQRLCYGACTEDDINVLRGLLVLDSDTPLPMAVLVTPRHGVRMRWNTASRMYICQAEDTRILSGKLAERVELAVGMRAMADLANGTRGEVVDFKLDPREEYPQKIDDDTGAIILRYPPVVVLFKPDSCTFPPFEGLPAGVLPILPTQRGFSIQTSNLKKHRIQRRQLAMTPAYAFTDYKSQGQTLEYVLIDLEKPPQLSLTPFSAYVALSRSRGRNSIRLLRGFEIELFTTHPSEELAVEDARLDALTEETKKRRRA